MAKIESKLVCQIGIIVEDIEGVVKNYTEYFDIEVPEIIISDPLEKANTEYRGEATEARVKQALFKMGQVQMEIMEPVGGPSTWRDFLEEHGPGIHHIAFEVESIDETKKVFDLKGGELIQKGDFTGGSYAYFDTIPALGVIVELLESD